MRNLTVTGCAALGILWFVPYAHITQPANAAQKLTIFAAASLKDSLDTIASSYQAVHPQTDIIISYASSGALARQIVHGAPADIFISAHVDWMDYLVDQGIIKTKQIRPIISNRLVVAAAKDVEINPSWQELLHKGRFAMGDPVHVPAGFYAKQALQNMSLWSSLRVNAVFGESAIIARHWLLRGELDAAILYQSDALVDKNITIVHRFDCKSHGFIIYPAATIESGNQLAGSFMEFLLAARGQQIFTQFGFEKLADDKMDAHHGKDNKQKGNACG